MTGTVVLHKTLIGPPSPEETVERYLSAYRDGRFSVTWDLLCFHQQGAYQRSSWKYVQAMWFMRSRDPGVADVEFTVGDATPGDTHGEWLVDVRVERDGRSSPGDVLVVEDDGEYLVC